MCLQTGEMEDQFQWQVPCGGWSTKSFAWRDTRTPRVFTCKEAPIVFFLYQTIICHECYIVLRAMRAENTPVPTTKVQMQSHCLLHVTVRLIGRDKRMRSSSCYVKHLSIRALSLLVRRKRRVTLSFQYRRNTHSRQLLSRQPSRQDRKHLFN